MAGRHRTNAGAPPQSPPILRGKGEGNPVIVRVPLFDPPVHVEVWKVAVGRVSLYLLDADLESNQPWDRKVAHHLYVGDVEQRLRQEIVLGMGGMCVLEALGIRPAALHLNEGHPAFAILERIRQLVEAGATFEQAAQRVRDTTIFTTHTPVAAGTDVFPFQLMEKYLHDYYSRLGTGRDAFLQLGANPQDPGAGFNMTVFALRMARFCNAVSQKHGQVARRMWAALWPDKKEDDVPIEFITNGVHLPSWIEPIRLRPLLDGSLGPAWLDHQDRPAIWELVDEIPDGDLWHLHQELKGLLIAQIDGYARARWQQDEVAACNVIAFGALLDPHIPDPWVCAAVHRLQAGRPCPLRSGAAEAPADRPAAPGTDHLRWQGPPGRRRGQASDPEGLSPGPGPPVRREDRVCRELRSAASGVYGARSRRLAQ